MKAKKVYEVVNTNEALGDVLKPKEGIDDLFIKHGITDAEISIRIRKPLGGYNDSFFQRILKGSNTTSSPYEGPVPEEEHENEFVKVSGQPWGVFTFVKNYFLPKYKGMSIDDKIEDLKNYMI